MCDGAMEGAACTCVSANPSRSSHFYTPRTHPTGPHYESLWTVDGKAANPKIGHDMGLVAMNSAVALGTH